ncbi:NAD(P)-binding protein [Xylona heveae TC161]|uniref:NAD(P)-binding protein n=1 Tax=Xylona heveae (strain CBS 132557 / TC161) TaxID=1328760 RepID=A0A164ZDW4_XYLHT|nr:NAD(P)-binding protein [Xylona heveae TC161]KZF18979.1 NAD(P)-binding protein [Xylona heveae TC161]
MAPKLLVVFGATGNQGGSLINYVLNDPVLSSEYTLRGVTRNTSSAASQSLSSRGVEMVSADPFSPSTLTSALSNAHTVFGMTNTVYDTADFGAREYAQGVAIADACVAAGVSFLIFSTLAHVSEVSHGKYTKVEGFDAKAKVEQYVRSKSIKSAFFAPGGFMTNYTGHMGPRPTGETDEAGNRIYAIASVMKPDSLIPQIDIEHDTGKYVGAILADPEKFEGKTLAASTELCTHAGIAAALAKKTGRKVVYKQVPVEMWKQFLPPVGANMLSEMMLYIDEFGYYGPNTKELMEATAKVTRGKLTTFEEFLDLSDFKLE